ncbi:hypothetical protein B0H12DRAFT_1073324 [Mycena haematopus]|nr:hypothetical protein B0H12DRAFT_1073324 [Mycena haematopus]
MVEMGGTRLGQEAVEMRILQKAGAGGKEDLKDIPRVPHNPRQREQNRRYGARMGVRRRWNGEGRCREETSISPTSPSPSLSASGEEVSAFSTSYSNPPSDVNNPDKPSLSMYDSPPTEVNDPAESNSEFRFRDWEGWGHMKTGMVRPGGWDEWGLGGLMSMTIKKKDGRRETHPYDANVQLPVLLTPPSARQTAPPHDNSSPPRSRTQSTRRTSTYTPPSPTASSPGSPRHSRPCARTRPGSAPDAEGNSEEQEHEAEVAAMVFVDLVQPSVDAQRARGDGEVEPVAELRRAVAPPAESRTLPPSRHESDNR